MEADIPLEEMTDLPNHLLVENVRRTLVTGVVSEEEARKRSQAPAAAMPSHGARGAAGHLAIKVRPSLTSRPASAHAVITPYTQQQQQHRPAPAAPRSARPCGASSSSSSAPVSPRDMPSSARGAAAQTPQPPPQPPGHRSAPHSPRAAAITGGASSHAPGKGGQAGAAVAVERRRRVAQSRWMGIGGAPSKVVQSAPRTSAASPRMNAAAERAERRAKFLEPRVLNGYRLPSDVLGAIASLPPSLKNLVTQLNAAEAALEAASDEEATMSHMRKRDAKATFELKQRYERMQREARLLQQQLGEMRAVMHAEESARHQAEKELAASSEQHRRTRHTQRRRLSERGGRVEHAHWYYDRLSLTPRQLAERIVRDEAARAEARPRGSTLSRRAAEEAAPGAAFARNAVARAALSAFVEEPLHASQPRTGGGGGTDDAADANEDSIALPPRLLQAAAVLARADARRRAKEAADAAAAGAANAESLMTRAEEAEKKAADAEDAAAVAIASAEEESDGSGLSMVDSFLADWTAQHCTTYADDDSGGGEEDGSAGVAGGGADSGGVADGGGEEDDFQIGQGEGYAAFIHIANRIGVEDEEGVFELVTARLEQLRQKVEVEALVAERRMEMDSWQARLHRVRSHGGSEDALPDEDGPPIKPAKPMKKPGASGGGADKVAAFSTEALAGSCSAAGAAPMDMGGENAMDGHEAERGAERGAEREAETALQTAKGGQGGEEGGAASETSPSEISPSEISRAMASLAEEQRALALKVHRAELNTRYAAERWEYRLGRLTEVLAGLKHLGSMARSALDTIAPRLWVPPEERKKEKMTSEAEADAARDVEAALAHEEQLLAAEQLAGGGGPAVTDDIERDSDFGVSSLPALHTASLRALDAIRSSLEEIHGICTDPRKAATAQAMVKAAQRASTRARHRRDMLQQDLDGGGGGRGGGRGAAAGAPAPAPLPPGVAAFLTGDAAAAERAASMIRVGPHRPGVDPNSDGEDDDRPSEADASSSASGATASFTSSSRAKLKSREQQVLRNPEWKGPLMRREKAAAPGSAAAAFGAPSVAAARRSSSIRRSR